MIRITAQFTRRSNIKTTKNRQVQGFGNLITPSLKRGICDTLEILFITRQRKTSRHQRQWTKEKRNRSALQFKDDFQSVLHRLSTLLFINIISSHSMQCESMLVTYLKFKFSCYFYSKRSLLKMYVETSSTDWKSSLKQLNEILDQNPQDTNLAIEAEHIRLEFQKIAEHKTKGTIIRSRDRWYEHGERSSKYFINLERHWYERKHNSKLKANENEYQEDQNKILFEMENLQDTDKTLYFYQIPEDTFDASA